MRYFRLSNRSLTLKILNMKKVILTVLVIVFAHLSGWSQQMSTVAYRDISIPYIELNPSKYNFAYPIQADILDSLNFTPPNDGVYLKATYGHRYLSSLSDRTDNHGGFDYWSNHSYNGINYDDSLKAPIICMCDGVISQVLNGPDSLLELTASGRSVRVTCDSISQAFGGSHSINYRHLSSLGALATIADTAAASTITIQKGEVIGLMGESGTTSNVHLHLSSNAVHPVNGNSFLSTARLFDPTLHPAVLKELTDATIDVLHDWPDSALVRVTWPYNQTINQFEFINQSDTVVFNKEEAYDTGSAIRDNHDCLPGIKVFAYQFNGKQTAQNRYLSGMNNIPAIYPASPNRDTNIALYGYQHVPITIDSVAYVYDFMVKGLSPAHQKEDFIIKLSDVWGYTVEGTFSVTSTIHEPSNRMAKVYPNPVIDEVNIIFAQDGPKTVTLFDMFGRLILSKESDQATASFRIGGHPKGVYLLQVESRNGVSTSKIIIE